MHISGKKLAQIRSGVGRLPKRKLAPSDNWRSIHGVLFRTAYDSNSGALRLETSTGQRYGLLKYATEAELREQIRTAIKDHITSLRSAEAAEKQAQEHKRALASIRDEETKIFTKDGIGIPPQVG